MSQRLKIVLTNDDGIEAKGMSYLVSALAATDIADLYIVAPHTEQSGKSMSFSFSTVLCASPYSYHQEVQEAWAVKGTPVDCVKIALRTMFQDSPPNLLISGINCGNNYGKNAWLSGTIGAAKQALLDDIPAIALSQDQHISCFQQEKAPLILKILIEYLLSSPFPCLTGLNVNFPASPELTSWKGVRLVPPGEEMIYEKPLFLGSVNKNHYYIGELLGPKIYGDPSSEYATVSENYISMSPLFIQNSPFGVISEQEFQQTQKSFETFLTNFDLSQVFS
ncbi:5'/3'-nucleotidase SurE [Chlamydia sp. 17-3921]|uniref:5'/3'-nucleotidase SurE n=1 Tax=Chlamydia sp. 17-3921 TaxID=2675798 RepID=UPI00191A18FD|nr:5'/3'-nucleotidase SurE [Chlamydia sp. 17-3921]